jgi:hypothetical protein
MARPESCGVAARRLNSGRRIRGPAVLAQSFSAVPFGAAGHRNHVGNRRPRSTPLATSLHHRPDPRQPSIGGLDDLHERDTLFNIDPPADDRRVFRCDACMWQMECLAREEVKVIAAGCPRCEGSLKPAPAALVSFPEPAVVLPVAPAPGRNKRLVPRRRPRAGIKVEVRRGGSGLGPHFGVALIDLSEDGLGLRLRSSSRPGDEVEVLLVRAWNSKPLKLLAEVRWCRKDRDGTFLSGVRLRRRLGRKEFLDLAR